MSISDPEDPVANDHDPELSRLLELVTSLGAARVALGPDAFLEQLSDLQVSFQELGKYRRATLLSARLEQFVQHRFDLVDEGTEYAHAADEALVLSMVLDGERRLAIPALRRAVEIASGHLLEEGVAPLFGQLLKRLRTFARTENDPELKAWVDGVVRYLPED
jgi:hypothetical protein